jgi:hypothetical protein
MSDPTGPDKARAEPTSAPPDTPAPEATPPAPPITPKANAIIESLLALNDPSAKALELIGFPGDVDKCGNIRLYHSLDLSTCYQFPAKNILYAEPPDPKDPTKPIKIVVDGGTNVEIVLSLETSFLEGVIAATHKLGDLKKLALTFLKEDTTAPCQAGTSSRCSDGDP